MTTTETAEATIPTTNDTWTEQFAELKARYPKVREPILVALHIITQNPEISLDDAKAQAAVHGTRITAASVSAAKRLLSRQDNATVTPTHTTPAPRKPAARRPRASSAPTDVESMIRQVAGKIRAEGDAEAERLRVAMRKAIDLLTEAVQ